MPCPFFPRRVLPAAMLLCTLAGSLSPLGAAAQQAGNALVLRAEKIYLAPDQPPLKDGAIVVRAGRIVSVGPASDLPTGSPAASKECRGAVITAGFYNSHVHLMGPHWEPGATIPRVQAEQNLTALATRHGFTTIVDLASDRDNTLAIKRRVDSGSISGPRILTLGLPLFPPKGLPFYLSALPPAFLAKLPQPETPVEARNIVETNMAAGAVGTKLFVVTPRREGNGIMPPDIARTAAETTHRAGGVVAAHPTDIAGVNAAIAAGVDVLAHTTHGSTTPWPPELLKQVAEKRIAMTPTLMLMGYELGKEGVKGPIVEELINASVAQTRAFIMAGGEVLFGTDAGYMTHLDPAQEYALLARAGMSPMDLLASLTTRPAARWKDAQRGKLAPGFAADIVVLQADPADDVLAFAKVRCTLVGGRIAYQAGKD